MESNFQALLEIYMTSEPRLDIFLLIAFPLLIQVLKLLIELRKSKCKEESSKGDNSHEG